MDERSLTRVGIIVSSVCVNEEVEPHILKNLPEYEWLPAMSKEVSYSRGLFIHYCVSEHSKPARR